MNSEASFLDIIPASLQHPQTYLVLFSVVFILVLVAMMYKRNLTISMFGRNLLDVQLKDSGSFTLSKKRARADNKEVSTVEDTNSFKKEFPTGNRVSVHSGCPHVNDFILIITETTNVVSEISEIKYKGCMSEQMFKADQHLIRMRTILQNKYRFLLARKANEQDQISGDNLVAYKFYQALTRIMLQDIKDLIIRAALLNNHLADFKSQGQYNDYIEKQFESIKNVINDTTIEMYMGNWEIKQSSVMELHNSTFLEIRSIVEDIFNDARDVAIRSQNKIEEMEKRLKQFVSRIAGING